MSLELMLLEGTTAFVVEGTMCFVRHNDLLYVKLRMKEHICPTTAMHSNVCLIKLVSQNS